MAWDFEPFVEARDDYRPPSPPSPQPPKAQDLDALDAYARQAAREFPTTLQEVSRAAYHYGEPGADYTAEDLRQALAFDRPTYERQSVMPDAYSAMMARLGPGNMPPQPGQLDVRPLELVPPSPQEAAGLPSARLAPLTSFGPNFPEVARAGIEATQVPFNIAGDWLQRHVTDPTIG